MTRHSLVPLLSGLLLLGTSACGKDTLDNLPPPPVVPPVTAVQVTPTALTYGDVQVGCSLTEAVQIENTGDEPIELGQAEVSGSAFVLSSQLPPTLAPGAQYSLGVTFAPEEVGAAHGSVRFTTSVSELPMVEVSLAGDAIVPAPKPVDLLIVIDVSTTMDAEMNALHDAVEALLDVVEQTGLDAQLYLASFVNDVIVHGNGAALDRSAFFSELESQLEYSGGLWNTNRDLPRNTENTDMEENILDGLHRAAAESALRVGVRRQLVLMTDDTFLEPPAVYTGDNPAQYSYDDVALQLLLEGIKLQAFHAVDHPDGFAAAYAGNASLVQMTGGTAFDLQSLVNGQLDLADILIEIVENSCDL